MSNSNKPFTFVTVDPERPAYIHRDLGYVAGRWNLLKLKVEAFIEEFGLDPEDVWAIELATGSSPRYSNCTFVSGKLPPSDLPQGPGWQDTPRGVTIYKSFNEAIQ